MWKSTNFLTTGLEGRDHGAVIGKSPKIEVGIPQTEVGVPQIEIGITDQVIEHVVVANVKAHVATPVQLRTTHAKYATKLVILRQFAIKREAKLPGGEEEVSLACQGQIKFKFTRCRAAPKTL